MENHSKTKHVKHKAKICLGFLFNLPKFSSIICMLISITIPMQSNAATSEPSKTAPSVELLNAQYNYQTAKNNYDNAKNANVNAKDEFQQAQTKLTDAQNNLSQKRTNLTNSQKNLDTATKNLQDAAKVVDTAWKNTH